MESDDRQHESVNERADDVRSSAAAALTDSRPTAASRAENRPAGNRLGFGFSAAPTVAASLAQAGSCSYQPL